MFSQALSSCTFLSWPHCYFSSLPSLPISLDLQQDNCGTLNTLCALSCVMASQSTHLFNKCFLSYPSLMSPVEISLISQGPHQIQLSSPVLS